MDARERDRQYWSRHARTYDRSMVLLGRPIPRMVELAGESVRGAGLVLEVGAGTGLVTPALARVAKEVIATDYAPAMIDALDARIRKERLANVRCEQADLYALRFEPASFDAVVATNVLHLVPDLPGAIAALRRVLTAGGRLVVPTYCHDEKPLSWAMSRLLSLTRFPGHRLFTARSLRESLESLGLVVHRTETIPGIIPIGFVEGTFRSAGSLSCWKQGRDRTTNDPGFRAPSSAGVVRAKKDIEVRGQPHGSNVACGAHSPNFGSAHTSPGKGRPMISSRLLSVVATTLAIAAPGAVRSGGGSAIQDNSFLIEEAYNQEPGVIQHISSFSRVVASGAWAYTFTEEWPVLGQTHQASITFQYARLGTPGGTGVGDLAVNYRWQAVGSGETALALAPRLTLLLSTGDAARGLGSGGTGGQLNIPLSAVLGASLVTHVNLGATWVPSALHAAGRGSLTSGAAGFSAVWLAHERFNLMAELLYTRSRIAGTAGIERAESLTFNPGVRGAFNLESGLQIVPGMSVPIGLGPSRGERALFVYLSLEHPFRPAGLTAEQQRERAATASAEP